MVDRDNVDRSLMPCLPGDSYKVEVFIQAAESRGGRRVHFYSMNIPVLGDYRSSVQLVQQMEATETAIHWGDFLHDGTMH